MPPAPPRDPPQIVAAPMAAAPPEPRSPPGHPDFCGRRRLQLEVQMLNREIDFLREESQSLEEVQPVSRCCKEVNEFVGANPDPLIPINKKKRKSCRFWKWIRSNLCFCFTSTCCSGGCSRCLLRPCCSCPHPTLGCCGDCQCSFCKVFCCWPTFCCPKVSCCKPRCRPRCLRWNDLCCKLSCCCSAASCCKPRCSLSCPEYSCGCIWSCPRCTEVQLCPRCSKTCCVSGCEC